VPTQAQPTCKEEYVPKRMGRVIAWVTQCNTGFFKFIHRPKLERVYMLLHQLVDSRYLSPLHLEACYGYQAHD
jgi:hypothetical protein